MLEAFIPLLSTGLGWMGSLFKAKEERKLQQLRFEHERAMFDLQLQETRVEAEGAVKLAKAEGEIQKELADSAVLTASYGAIGPWFSGTQSKWLRFVDGLRSLMRPFITLYMLILTTYIATNIHAVVGGIGSLPEPDAVEIYNTIILSIISLTMTVVGWWFGSRKSLEGK